MPDSQDGEGGGVAHMVMRVERAGGSQARGLNLSNWPLSLCPANTDVSRLWQPYGDCVEPASPEQTKHIVSSKSRWPRTAPGCYLARQAEARQAEARQATWLIANEQASFLGCRLTKPYRYQSSAIPSRVIQSRVIRYQKPQTQSISIKRAWNSKFD